MENEPSTTDMEPELQVIQSINKSLDNIQRLSSTGVGNNLYHLLEIPEISQLAVPDEGTIDYVESFVNDPLEQRLISEFDPLSLNEDTDDLSSLSLIKKTGKSDTCTTNVNSVTTQDAVAKVQSEATSPSRSKYLSFLNFFNARKRRKAEANAPGSNSSMPSCNSQNDIPDVDQAHLEAAKILIQDIEAQGPAGTPHLSSLARTVHRPILAFSSSMTLSHHAGRDIEGSPIQIQFHSARPGMATGHWTLLGNQEPDGIPRSLNNCLFNVVCTQTGRKPSELRKETITEMWKHLPSLARRMQAMLKQEDCGRLVILIGGASYSGSSAIDAQKVIDDSQDGRCHPGHQQGHPRGHSSNPGASGRTESAENYSRGGWRTGFRSREDQDDVGHKALETPAGQGAMQALNQGSQSESVHLLPSALSGSLPQVAEFVDGNMQSPRPIKELVLVLRHHAGHAHEPDYPVFITTFYPKIT